VKTAVFAGSYGPRHIFIDDEAVCGAQGGLLTSGEIIDWAFPICDRCMRGWATRLEKERDADAA
jgi:hypothetical protein